MLGHSKLVSGPTLPSYMMRAGGDERCLGGLQMHRTSFRFSELQKSHFLYGSNCVVLINRIMKKKTWTEDQKLKINLKWPTFTKGR